MVSRLGAGGGFWNPVRSECSAAVRSSMRRVHKCRVRLRAPMVELIALPFREYAARVVYRSLILYGPTVKH